jgi:hypothetical protein
MIENLARLTAASNTRRVQGRLALVLFFTLQLLVQAWYINTSAGQGETLTGKFPSAAKLTIAQLDAVDDDRTSAVITPSYIALTLPPFFAMVTAQNTGNEINVPHPPRRLIYQEISVLRI